MSELRWVFESSTGRVYSPEGQYVGAGYAGGDLGRHPEGINNPKLQAIKDIGPLPEGWYTFGPWISHHPTLGADVFALIPDAANEMYGRSDFYEHGDTPTPRCASQGCIVLANAIRRVMYSPQYGVRRRLQVVAVYQQ